jgi:uncharacterized membrane protein YidH (DUF202 family)
MDTIKTIRLHSLVLVLCSLTGFFGFYFQYGIFQITAFIPAMVGLILFTISIIRSKNNIARHALLFLITLVFGIILTRMSATFIPQQFQPMRKRIYFPVMALSSIFAVVVMVKNYLGYKKNTW